MTKILLLLTGGTIGSESEDGVLKVSQRAVSQLETLWRDSHQDTEIHFLTENPYSLLSENARPAQWDLLTEAVRDRVAEVDGVIIAHGSDTLAFTAAALSFSLAGIGIPVVVTGADRPLDDPRGNGMRNFSASVDFVHRHRIPGVFAIFENPDKQMLVHLGCRVKSARVMEHRFDSLYSQPFGQYRREGLTLFSNASASISKLKKEATGLKFAHLRFCPEVMMLQPYPGLNYDRICIQGLRAVLHGAYHSSTACTEGESTSLLSFASRLKEQGTLLLLGPADVRTEQYESSSLLSDAGVTLLGPMTREAALAKLMLGASCCATSERLASWMQKPIGMEQG